MTATIIHIPEPGTIRSINFHTKPDENGKYPVTYWGTIDEQIAEATHANLVDHSSTGHEEMPLWTLAENCEHTNPDGMEKYEGVEDLLDAWVARNLPGMDWRDGSLYYKNRRRGEAVIPLYAEWSKAQREYDDGHEGNICLLDYQGTCCTGCTEGDEDFGYETGSCQRAWRAKEAQSDFWALFTTDWIEQRARDEQAASV